jgi:hypothetical protein
LALQFSVAVRNGMLDSIETTAGTSAKLAIFTGSPPANCGTANSGTLLILYSLASDWASAASTGAKALSSLPLTGAATGTGTAGYFRLYASDGTTCHMQGTAGESATDMILDNSDINATQTVNVTAFTITAPGV